MKIIKEYLVELIGIADSLEFILRDVGNNSKAAEVNNITKRLYSKLMEISLAQRDLEE